MILTPSMIRRGWRRPLFDYHYTSYGWEECVYQAAKHTGGPWEAGDLTFARLDGADEWTASWHLYAPDTTGGDATTYGSARIVTLNDVLRLLDALKIRDPRVPVRDPAAEAGESHEETAEDEAVAEEDEDPVRAETERRRDEERKMWMKKRDDIPVRTEEENEWLMRDGQFIS